MTHGQAQKKILEIKSEWQEREGLWIHIHGDDTAGVNWFIQKMMSGRLKAYSPLLNYHFEIFPWQAALPARMAIRDILHQYQEDFNHFLEQYPVKLQNLIRRYTGEDAPPLEGSSGELTWEFNLLRQFIDFLSRKRRLVLILEGIFDSASDPVKGLFKTLEDVRKFPLLIISSGGNEADVDTHYKIHNIHLEKLSLRETEKVIVEHLRTNPVNARVITNHIYTKSHGNLRDVKFMVEAYYRPLLSDEKERVIDSATLNRTVVSSDPEKIFKQLIRQFPEATLDIFAFLSRLEDPFPREHFLKILKKYRYGKKELQQWLEMEILREAQFLQKSFVFIDWDAWKEFLRKNASVERIDRILKFLKDNLVQEDWEYPLEVSNQFFNVDDTAAALAIAHREARLFAEFGIYRRAFDRYAFLRRNLPRFPQPALRITDVLKEMGELQKRLGLYENAFESFREQREYLQRKEREEWIDVSLEMADTLFQMDALSEARYLIKELKLKNATSPRARFFANILMGELEQNFGHADYAMRHFETALTLLPRVNDVALINRLYSILKENYLSADMGDEYINLILQIVKALDGNSSYQLYYQLELIKYHVTLHDFGTALPLALSVYRARLNTLSPLVAAQIRLYLAEIYGYYGKWRLSRNHLKALLRNGVFITNTNLRLRVMVNLGIVEKELGHYSVALELLQDAVNLCLAHNLTSRMNYIRLHLGHIYLLVYNFMRAREYLVQTLAWAEENRDEEMMVLAALFLSSYEMQQNRMASAEEYLNKAAAAIRLSDTLIDRLNHYYYWVIYKLKLGDLEGAAKTLDDWEKENKGITKFEILWLWLSGRVLMEKADYPGARERLEAALSKSLAYRLPYLELQVLRDLAALAKRQKDNSSFKHYSAKAQEAFRKFIDGVGDEILKRQIQESREYEDMLPLSS